MVKYTAQYFVNSSLLSDIVYLFLLFPMGKHFILFCYFPFLLKNTNK